MGRLKVLVTGASGLLGRHVVEVLRRESCEVRGLCCSRGGQYPDLVVCDLTEDGAAAAQIEEYRPHAVIHLAAEWRPDALRRSPAQTRRLNVDASGAIATACQRYGAWLVYVSADSVFDGRSPPYAIDSEPNPLSEYGWHKLHGEQLTMVACPQAAVLRVGLLYGPCKQMSDSAITSLRMDLLNGVQEVDAWQRCYPTWTGDVAGVIAAMLRLYRQGEGDALRGVFHWQGSEQLTWHEMMLLVAEISGLDASDVAAVRAPPAALLPRDSRLDCSRLEGLLGPAVGSLRTPFAEGLQRCLYPLLAGVPALGRKAIAEPPQARPAARTDAIAAGTAMEAVMGAGAAASAPTPSTAAVAAVPSVVDAMAPAVPTGRSRGCEGEADLHNDIGATSGGFCGSAASFGAGTGVESEVADGPSQCLRAHGEAEAAAAVSTAAGTATEARPVSTRDTLIASSRSSYARESEADPLSATAPAGGTTSAERGASPGTRALLGLTRMGSGAAGKGGPLDPESQFRDELKKRGAALQELFWQELERTRNRLKEAGLAEGRRGSVPGGASDRGGAAARLPRRRMLKVGDAAGRAGAEEWSASADGELDGQVGARLGLRGPASPPRSERSLATDPLGVRPVSTFH